MIVRQLLSRCLLNPSAHVHDYVYFHHWWLRPTPTENSIRGRENKGTYMCQLVTLMADEWPVFVPTYHCD